MNKNTFKANFFHGAIRNMNPGETRIYEFEQYNRPLMLVLEHSEDGRISAEMSSINSRMKPNPIVSNSIDRVMQYCLKRIIKSSVNQMIENGYGRLMTEQEITELEQV